MKKISIMILLLGAVLASCKKTLEVNLKYVDVERDLITVGTTTATIQCDYEYIATLKKVFLNYCEGTDTTNMSVAEMSVVQKTLYVELSGLKENTTYSYYYEFANGFNSMRSAAKTFKTEASPVTPPEITLPTVVTAEVTEITSNSAQCGGEVTNDGGAEVTERGICWSTNVDPTLNDSYITSGTGTGAFTAMMSSLEVNTTYHVRAYAFNEAGTAYGLDREFTTLRDYPIGAINGLFTINENGDQVYFSQGNLQYQASTNTWRFAENQWNFVGGLVTNNSGETAEYGNVYEGGVKCDNLLISSTYFGWIDLFGWGTSGYHDTNDPNNTCYQPWSYSWNTVNSVYNQYGYGPSLNMPSPDLTGSSANYDWGVYNAISNGGNVSNQWRTLTASEWDYLINRGYINAQVNSTNGIILLPDNWDSSCFVFYQDPYYLSNIINDTQWTYLEQNGAVFLPQTGHREFTFDYENLKLVSGDYGCYWTASVYGSDGAPYVMFTGTDFDLYHNGLRLYGRSVRLVQDANK